MYSYESYDRDTDNEEVDEKRRGWAERQGLGQRYAK